MIGKIVSIPWWLLVAGSLTLGLAPFYPVPHLAEKGLMLVQGDLTRPIDIFDLLLHAAFPVLLFARVFHSLCARTRG